MFTKAFDHFSALLKAWTYCYKKKASSLDFIINGLTIKLMFCSTVLDLEM